MDPKYQTQRVGVEEGNKMPVIAVVDDSAPLCEMLCELLNEEGYFTHPYVSGSDALEGIKRHQPDLILLDIDMPDMNGFDVCAKLKSDPQLMAIPVFFISSYSELDDKLRAFDCGALDYVTKPIHLAEVKARIKTHLSLRYYQQALQVRNDTLAATLMQLKSAQHQLVQAEKLASLGQLVAGVAHEINNPISFIIGNGHALKKNLDKLEGYLERVHASPQSQEAETMRKTSGIDIMFNDMPPMVSDILEAAGRVSTIVQDLSLLSAQQQAEKAALNLKEVVELAIKWVAASRHCEEHIHAERLEDIVVIGHKGQLVQVVVNLLNNALDACENAAIPSVIVQCAAENGHGWISISDNGTGISDSQLGQLFDPFFTTKLVGKGCGLGLAISYRLMAEHGGELTAENIPESGARFTLTVPLEDSSFLPD